MLETTLLIKVLCLTLILSINALLYVNATIPKENYYKWLDEDSKDQRYIWTGGAEYMYNLFSKLSFVYPASEGVRRPYYTKSVVIYAGNREMKPATCRLANFLNECNHDFTELNGNGGNDNTRPLFNDFAITDKPNTELSMVPYPDFQYFPAFASATVPVHSVAGFSDSDPLILSREALAMIFRGAIERWDDPKILETNPDHVADLQNAGEIKVVVRAGYSILTQLFKNTLGGFDPLFKSQIGNTGNADWNGFPALRLVFREADSGTSSYISYNASAIGYVPLSEVVSYKIQKVALASKNNTTALPTEQRKPIICTPTSTQLAVSDKGLDFGNNGRLASRLTADVYGSNNIHAWPIVTYIYFGIRLNTLRPGADCSTRKDVFDFLNWFYNDKQSQMIIDQNGFAYLPDSVRNVAMDMLKSSLKCDGNYVYDKYQGKILVKVYGPKIFDKMFTIINAAYQELNKVILPEYYIDNDQHTTIMQVLSNVPSESAAENAFVAVVKESDTDLMNVIKQNKNLQLYPYAGISFAVIINICGPDNRASCLFVNTKINLDVMTLSQIFSGEITYWDDEKIIMHNPTLMGSLPHKQILVIIPDNEVSTVSFINMIKKVNPSFAFISSAQTVDSQLSAKVATFETSYSITYNQLNGAVVTLARLASIKNKYGSYVQPSADAVEACASDTYSVETGGFDDLGSSMNENCYPLIETAYVVSPINYNTCSEEIEATTKYLQWIIRGDGSLVHNNDTVHHPAHNKSSIVDTSSDVKAALTNNYFGPLFYTNVYGPKVRSDGLSLIFKIVDKLEMIHCGEQQMLMKHAGLNLIPMSLIVIVFSLASVCILITTGLSIWLYINRKKRLIRNSSPIFMFQILFGATLSLLTIFPMGMQDDAFNFHQATADTDWKHLDRACQAVPFLYSLGFAISFSALFVKTWRLVKLFNNRKFKKLKITDWMLLRYQIAIVSSIFIFNVVWIAIDPLVWMRIPISLSETGEVLQSAGICGMQYDVYYAIVPLLVIMILLLAVGNYLSYQTRFIPSDYAESKWVAFSMVLYLEALVLGVPVVIMASGNTNASFLVKSVAIILADFGTVLLIFIPKIWLLYGWDVEGQSTMNKEDSSSSSSKESRVKSSKKEIVSNNSIPNATVTPSTSIGVQVTKSKQSSIRPLHAVNSFYESNASSLDRRIGDNTCNVRVSIKRTDKEIPVKICEEIYPSLHDALRYDAVQRTLIDFASKRYFDEPIRFYGDVVDFQRAKKAEIRIKKGVNIIKKYLLPNSPLEVHLPSLLKTRYENVMHLYENEIKENYVKSKWFSGASSQEKANQDHIVPVADVTTETHGSPKQKAIQIKQTDQKASEQISELDFFLPVQNSVIGEILENKLKWKPVITFLDDHISKNDVDEASNISPYHNEKKEGSKISQISLQ